ncbi:MAG TPA: hypothetical protein DIC19_06085 [Erysipelotrichaceae bacterium]|nr:hypothetical protein [Erysipelotrichaceae bacterium]
MKDVNYTLRISPFKQKIILRQLALAIGLPFGALIILMILLRAWYGLALVMVLLSLNAIFVSLVYGRYGMHYSINKDGVLAEPDRKQAKTNHTLNALTLFAGIYAKSPTVAGASVLANANQRQMFEWSSIKMIIQKKDHFEITHRNNSVLILNYPDDLENDIITALRYWGKDIHHA